MIAEPISKLNGHHRSIFSVALRGISVWTLIMTAETLNGALRESLFVGAFGPVWARQLSFGIALVLIMSIATYFVNWIGAAGTYQWLIVGATWVSLTICFEVVLGVIVLDLSWELIAADYDLSRGGLMSIGLVFMLFAPMLAARLREPAS